MTTSSQAALRETLREQALEAEQHRGPHKLIGGSLKTEKGGIAARCTCGWASAGHFTSAGASAAFRAHKGE